MRNIVKSAILTLALGAATAAFAQAPDQPTAPPPAQQATAPMRQPDPVKEAKRLSRALSLTPDQTTQVQGIFADREQRVQTLMSTNPDQKTMRRQRRAITQDEQAKINAILTPAQQQQFAALKSERRQHGAPGAPPPSNQA